VRKRGVQASLTHFKGWMSLGELTMPGRGRGGTVDGGKNSRLQALRHSSVIGQEIEELAKKARRVVTCEVVGDPGECE